MKPQETRPVTVDRAGTGADADESTTDPQRNARPLYVPAIADDVDVLTAALSYADSGWFCLPIRAGTKNPGSVLGSGWQEQSSRDPRQITAWYAGTSHGIALHMGRSGALAFDVDHPDLMPPVLADAFQAATPPFQSTRDNDPGRGHYVFRQPAGHVVGNSPGRLGSSWGELRGRHGVIVVAPSRHTRVGDGGRYQWIRTGAVPALPDSLAALLPAAGELVTVPAETAGVAAFLAEHNHGRETWKLDHLCDRFTAVVTAGASRHATAVDLLCYAAKEAAAGSYPASIAVERLETLFRAAVRSEPGRERPGEWAEILRFAVGAALADDTAARRADFEARSTGGTTFTATGPAEQTATPQADVTAPDNGREIRSLRARLLTREQLRDLPEPEPLIDRTLDRGTVGMLVGHTGTCKTFTALSWAASVATGVAWQCRKVCATGTVLYVAAEGASGINSRLSAWENHNDTKVPDDALITLPVPGNLGRAADVAEICSIAHERQVMLVVLDTLNRCAVGLEENSATDMGVAIAALYAIQRCTSEGRGTVLLVHHTGKDKATTRGSSALEDGFDTVYFAEGDPRAVRLSRTKRRDGPADDVLTLRLNPVGSSAVLVHGVADMTANEDQLLSAFLSTFSVTGASKSDLRTTCGIPPASFHRALNVLVERGLLVNTGTDKRPFYTPGVLL